MCLTHNIIVGDCSFDKRFECDSCFSREIFEEIVAQR